MRVAVTALASNIHGTAYKSNTVFIDPIDGTREFASGKGEECTVLVGLADEAGQSVSGLIYRPIANPPIWAVGCKSEGFARTNVALRPPSKETSIVTTNGSISKFTDVLISKGMPRVKSGGAGNKSLLLLEGKGSAYIQDRVCRGGTHAAHRRCWKRLVACSSN